MSLILDGTSNAITFPDTTVQSTSALVAGKVPYSTLPAGTVIQTVTYSSNTSFTTTSTSYVSTGFSVSITPRYSTSKIAIIISSTMGSSNFGSGYGTGATLYRNSTNLAQGGGAVGMTAGYIASTGSGGCMPVVINYVDSPSTTSSTAYTVYILNSLGSANTSWNSSNNVFNSTTGTMILMEIAA